MWIEEEVKPGNLSNGTVMAYQGAVGRIKQFPIGSRKLKTVTSEHLQMFFDLLSFGGTNADGTKVKPISKGYMRQFSAVMQGAFRFAVFPKRLIRFGHCTSCLFDNSSVKLCKARHAVPFVP